MIGCDGLERESSVIAILHYWQGAPNDLYVTFIVNKNNAEDRWNKVLE
jgi:hypothetical protein